MNLLCAMDPQTIILIVVVVVLLAAIIVVPMFTNKKRQKQVVDLHNSLEIGDTVTTVGGVIGKVVDIRTISPTDKQFTISTGTDEAPSTMTFDINAIYIINNKQPGTVRPAAPVVPEVEEAPAEVEVAAEDTSSDEKAE